MLILYMIQDVEWNMKKMLNSFNEILNETSKSKRVFGQEEVENYVNVLQNSYD